MNFIVALLSVIVIGTSIYSELYGVLFLFVLYMLPISIFSLKKLIVKGLPKSEYIFDFLRQKNIFLILMYVSFTMTIFSLIGSLYPSYHTEPSAFTRVLSTVNDSGIVSVYLILPIFIITLILDRAITKLSGFIYTEKGLYDPITGQENISLRYNTFINLINSIDEASVKAIGEAIGKDYGQVLVDKYTVSEMEDFFSYWLETDKKAGLIEDLKKEGTERSPNIKVLNSFAKRIRKAEEEKILEPNQVCTFLEAYVAGVLAPFDSKKLYSLDVEKCQECTTHNVCYFKSNNR